MFTGLIDGTAEIVRTGSGLIVAKGDVLDGASAGDSVAVDGTCLTVTAADGPVIGFHASAETRRRSLAGTYTPGTIVNIEHPLRAGDRLHGHFVTGHSDCTSTVLGVEGAGGDRLVRIAIPEGFEGLLVEKGSVAVSGVSLTVAGIRGRGFSVVLVPETLSRTTAAGWKPGTGVCLEFDIIGKYVVRHLDAADGRARLREYLEDSGGY